MDYLHILEKYRENKATPEEVEFLEKWLKDGKNLNQFKDYLAAEWEEYVDIDTVENAKFSEVLDTINLNIDEQRQEQSPRGTNSHRYLRWAVLSGLAASLGLICLYLWVFPFASKNSDPAFAKVITEVKYNPKGQKLIIVLRDGSRVKLNADSELSFPETFDEDKRVVHLKGEAFFEVTKDATRPFTVVTENITTTALGTSFNIKAFGNQKEIEIILATGKVDVKNTIAQANGSSQSMILDPHFRATFNRINKGLQKDSIDITEKLAWKDGILYFNDANLDEIKEKLERWYNVEVVVKNPQQWGNRQFTGKFDNESLKNVMKGISFSSHLKYKIKGRMVFINL